MRIKFSGIRAALSITFISLFLTACSSKKTVTETTAGKDETTSVDETASIKHEPIEGKAAVAKLYELNHMKEWYPERIAAPTFDYSMDISNKSIVELWLLRNEIFARNGHLFDDAVLRGYFSQFKWYQPVFNVSEFKVQLDKQEQEFVNVLIARENELAKDRYVNDGVYTMINTDQLYNTIQFKQVPAKLMDQLKKTNFAIVPAKHEQLFHVYDENHYQYIPSFITTDIYLQVLHKHFSSILLRMEEDKFTPLLTNLVKSIHGESIKFERIASDDQLKKAAEWTTTYLAIAYTSLTGRQLSVAPEMNQAYKDEVQRVKSAQGIGSEFLKSELIQYSLFVPRGNYTKTPELENYFRCMKWLNTAPMFIDQDESLLSAVLIAAFIKQSSSSLQAFQNFNEAIKFIVGEEDNLSVSHVINSITIDEAKNPASLRDANKLESLRKKLEAINPDKIKPLMASDAAAEVLKPNVLFTPGRYAFDAEILSKLVHVIQPNARRPFPKGLDIFATLGSKEAENILLNEYGEAKNWDDYPKELLKLQKQFDQPDWSKNIYTKTFEAINNLRTTDDRHPLFMKTPAWGRKNLITSLASWTELKHDMLLYAEQPYAAQAGEGGGPPPPQHIGYVEPNISFWKKALELIDLQEKTLSNLKLIDEDIKYINNQLREIGNMLLTISEKELNQQPLDTKEFEEISWLGGRIEYLTFRIFDTDHLPSKERLVALVADVYRNNNTYLEEATGLVDEIYVVAEINGKPYITRGAVFSYYEFTRDQPLTDEQWQKQLLEGKAPQRPDWAKKIMIETNALEAKAEYSLLGADMY